jgi:hypothetical protein
MSDHAWVKYRLNQRPRDSLDRISTDGYLGKMKSNFARHNDGGFRVYVIELDSGVWQDSLQRNSDQRSVKWIPSFPKGLPDPKIEKTDDWKNLDTGDVKGFLYVGQTWLGFEERHEQHCKGEKHSPVVMEHGCDPSQLWPRERCLTRLYDVQTSWMLESWYGWALSKCGYVVYGPNFHRNHRGFGKVYEECVGFMGEDPFW